MTNQPSKTVLYTRSRRYFSTFVAAIAPYPITTYHLPLMDIRQIPYHYNNLPVTIPQCRKRLENCDTAIFTSTAAVELFDFSLLPKHTQHIAIGRATARLLPHTNITAPAPYTSEALLTRYHPQGEKIVIIGGMGGRDYLQNTLQQHNHVDKIAIYQRYNPSPTWPYPKTQIFDAITIASIGTLDHLIQIVPQNILKLLQCHSQIITLSERISKQATKYGFLHINTVPCADETTLLKTLLRTLGVNHE